MPIEPLTSRQAEVLNLIIDHIETRGVPPTYRWLMGEIGVSNTNALVCHLKPLKKKGYITWDHRTSRALRVRFRADMTPYGSPIVRLAESVELLQEAVDYLDLTDPRQRELAKRIETFCQLPAREVEAD